MAFRCEVYIPRTGEWVGYDEERGGLTHAKYERALLRCYPILKTREYRIVQFDAPPLSTIVAFSIPLALPK